MRRYCPAERSSRLRAVQAIAVADAQSRLHGDWHKVCCSSATGQHGMVGQRRRQEEGRTAFLVHGYAVEIMPIRGPQIIVQAMPFCLVRTTPSANQSKAHGEHRFRARGDAMAGTRARPT